MQSNGENISYVLGCAEHIPFRDRMFDLVTCFSSFHWFDAGAAIPEVRRVLTSGGLLAVVNKNDTSVLKKRFRQLIRRMMDIPIPNVKDRYDPEPLLAAAGPISLTQHCIEIQETFSPAEAQLYLQSTSLWNLVPDDRQPEAINSVLRLCEEVAVDGLINREVLVETLVASF